jgi:hypothetical protein
MEGPEIKFAEAVIDNGKFGKRTVRFETGRLAQQAQGAVAAYLDEDTMILSATSAGKHLPAHGRRRRAFLRRRQNPRIVLPPRGPSLHGSHPGLPSHRPPAAPDLR